MEGLTESEAASLALALVAVATASVDGGEDAMRASDHGLVELVDGLSDVPLTDRQAEVVEMIGSASAAITAGISSALAEQRDLDVHVVLRLAARAVVEHSHGAGGRAA